MMPNWDIHPEMVTHTRVIDTKTGHPYPDHSLKFMENWDWTTGRRVDEIAEYLAYALRILKNAGLPCEGITTPGGFGNKALPQLAQATLQSVRDVFGAEIPALLPPSLSTAASKASRRASNMPAGSTAPTRAAWCSIIGCTGDWTGGWDCTPPERSGQVHHRRSAKRTHGRCHRARRAGASWSAIGRASTGTARNSASKSSRKSCAGCTRASTICIWMKLSEVSRYWAAKELTRIAQNGNTISLRAPFACPDFTVKFDAKENATPRLRVNQELTALKEVKGPLQLTSGTWCREREKITACFALPKGASELEVTV